MLLVMEQSSYPGEENFHFLEVDPFQPPGPPGLPWLRLRERERCTGASTSAAVAPVLAPGLFQGTRRRTKPRPSCHMRGPMATARTPRWLPVSQPTVLHQLFSCLLAVLSSFWIPSPSISGLEMLGHFKERKAKKECPSLDILCK
jgi:hypothetical protein